MAAKLHYDDTQMTDDRRRLQRLNVHFDVELSTPDHDVVVKTVTENLSGSGFFCTSDHPFAPGARLSCELSIPTETVGISSAKLTLHRRVTVLRVEIRGLEPGFGLACAFEEALGTRGIYGASAGNHPASGPTPDDKGQLKPVARRRRS